MDEKQVLMYFWIDERKSTIQEFFETVDRAFYDNAVRRQKVFKVLTPKSFPERIYLSLN